MTTPTAVRANREVLTTWLLVLLSQGDAYGYALRAELAERNIKVDAPVMYRALRRLEQRGLVKSDWAVSAIGPRRRSYTITCAGRGELDRLVCVAAAVHDMHTALLSAYAGNAA